MFNIDEIDTYDVVIYGRSPAHKIVEITSNEKKEVVIVKSNYDHRWKGGSIILSLRSKLDLK